MNYCHHYYVIFKAPHNKRLVVSSTLEYTRIFVKLQDKSEESHSDCSAALNDVSTFSHAFVVYLNRTTAATKTPPAPRRPAGRPAAPTTRGTEEPTATQRVRPPGAAMTTATRATRRWRLGGPLTATTTAALRSNAG